MELVRGIPITQYCDQAHLTTRQRLEIFIQVCQAIQHAHQKGIIHRDIKPSNILVTFHDGVPVPKVIDFGIAKAIEGRLADATVFTQLHQFIGTPAYMSPEQAEMTGLDIDTRSDIYSLGVLLYELLAGSTPFEAKELVASGLDAMREAIREQDPPRRSTRFRTLPAQDSTTTAQRRSTDAAKLIQQLRGDLDWIVMKCLEKDRTRRYETANGLAFDLKRHLNDEPVLARPPSAAYRFQKALRRHRLAFTAATGVALALVGGIAISTWQTLAARKAQRETEEARENESKANELLRVQMGQTEKAKRSADEAAQSEGEQRRRAEAALQLMQLQKAEEFLVADEAAVAVGYLGRVLRGTPYNEVAAARLASAMLRPFAKELTEPLRHSGPVSSARFSLDGLRIITASDDGTARLWDVEPPSLPVPDWFLDWAEARVGRRFAAADGTEAIPFAEQRQQRERVQSRTDTTFNTRLAQWVEADPTTRAISPNAIVTMPEHVRRLMDANTVASLREALALSPTESLAWGRLALHLATGGGDPNREDRLAEAEWDARHALRLDP